MLAWLCRWVHLIRWTPPSALREFLSWNITGKLPCVCEHPRAYTPEFTCMWLSSVERDQHFPHTFSEAFDPWVTVFRVHHLLHNYSIGEMCEQWHWKKKDLEVSVDGLKWASHLGWLPAKARWPWAVLWGPLSSRKITVLVSLGLVTPYPDYIIIYFFKLLIFETVNR